MKRAPNAEDARRATRLTVALMLLILRATTSLADNPKPHQLAPVPIQQVAIQDEFWSPKLKTWRTVTIPDCLAKFEKDGALTNFDKIRDGTGGEHGGPPWYDGLIYEMIRGGADFLASQRDAVLEARLDSYIERIAAAAAKDPDGYLNTYTQLKEPGHRWGLNGGDDNHQHDVYNAGAMVEAAVHYFRATGKTKLLQVATRLANHMADVMGPPPKQNVVPGHSLGEEAMVKLYLLFREKPELKAQMPVSVDEARYLKLAEFWIENRGNHEGRKSYGPYGQDHLSALNDQIEPAASDDLKIPRFTWWNHRGTKEWVQYDFEQATKVSAVEVYWWDERRINAHCRVPQSWRLLYQSGDAWKPVTGAAACGVEMDRFNRFPFDPVETKALRLEVELQPEWSGGILEWRVE